MNLTYGKWDFSSLTKSEENSYVLSNGLGGVSTLTMAGSATRSDHALLSVSLDAPVKRMQLIKTLHEQVLSGHKKHKLYTQKYIDRPPVTGYKNISSFTFDDYPSWIFNTNGVETEKNISFEYGKNALAVSYHVTNDTENPVTLRVRPLLAFSEKGASDAERVNLDVSKGCLYHDSVNLYFKTNGTLLEEKGVFTADMAYDYDERDGRPPQGNAFSNHVIEFETAPLSENDFYIYYTTDKNGHFDPNVFHNESERKNALVKASGLTSPAAACLIKNGDAFLSLRNSTQEKTILAGYPFFYDWGRDTMIAVMGLCTASHRYDDTKSILKSFTNYLKDGLLPNMFPGRGEAPLYNTVDASLLWIVALYDYFKETNDTDFLKEMYPFGKEIIKYYKEGTSYNIGMDSDGLIRAGEGFYQLTWMDVRLGDILPTRRHGKPVEINAWWYNSLMAMDIFSETLNITDTSYGEMAAKTKESFNKQFWNAKASCLKDVVSGNYYDNQIRSNQIWAVSAPFALLDRDKEKAVVRKVFSELYTPYGLRTLSPSDSEYHGRYTGSQKSRDMAYHQGTVWPFPLGAYYRAFLKVSDYTPSAVKRVKRELRGLESALREGGIGFISEVYDGTLPKRSKGCYAQAWSVGEIIRVYKDLENN